MAVLAEDPLPSMTEDDPEPVYAELSRETLYELLVAEMAGKQNRLDIALGNYMRQAHLTQDPKVIRRYATIAAYMQAHQATSDATELWLKVEPANPDALHLALADALRSGEAETMRNAWQALLSQTSKLDTGFLSEAVASSSRDAKKSARKVLTELLKDDHWQDNFQLWYISAQLNANLGASEQALANLNRVQKIERDFVPGLVLAAGLYEQQKDAQSLLKTLKRLSSLQPQNKKIRIYYVRALVQTDHLRKAENEIMDLIALFPKDHDIKLTAAVINAELKEFETAAALLNEVITAEHRQNEAYLQLGIIAELQELPIKARKLYEQVTPGTGFQDAQLRIAQLYVNADQFEAALKQLETAIERQPKSALVLQVSIAELLSEQGQADRALAHLDKALEPDPEVVPLLYARAMIAETQDKFAQFEQDLRKILELDADNAAALNALGYTYANRNIHLDEARELVERAHEIAPDDAAILDSLGWTYYRLGDLSAAEDYLARAYDELKDAEVAAHYGEVLWQLDKQRQAKKVWRKALQEHPKAQILQETLKRFKVEL